MERGPGAAAVCPLNGLETWRNAVSIRSQDQSRACFPVHGKLKWDRPRRSTAPETRPEKEGARPGDKRVAAGPGCSPFPQDRRQPGPGRGLGGSAASRRSPSGAAPHGLALTKRDGTAVQVGDSETTQATPGTKGHLNATSPEMTTWPGWGGTQAKGQPRGPQSRPLPGAPG